jgi:hypothetical protein
MSTQFDLAQSFFIDREAVENAAVVHITSVDLYFNTKPAAGKSLTNIYKPGVSLYICPLTNEQPDLDKVVQGCVARVEWDNVATSGTAATATKFTFDRPVTVATDGQYAFLIRFDGSDNDFKLWWSESGETYVNTSAQATVTSGFNDGNFYKITNGNVLTKTTNADLKFVVNIAKFSSLSSTFKFDERKYELFSYFANSITGNFLTGEYVYKNAAAQTGTVNVSSNSYTVTGQTSTTLSTTFAAGDYVVISDGTAGNTVIRVVNSVASASSMTIDEKPHFTANTISYYKTAVAKVYLFDKKSDHMILTDSNANSTLYFANNDYIKGEDSQKQIRIESLKDFDISRVSAQFNIVTPALTAADASAGFANTVMYTSTSQSINLPIAKRQFVDYDAKIGSKSLIATNSNTSLFTGNVSVNGVITFTSSNKYSSPYLEEEDADLFVYRYIVNNDATNEETGNGNATSRYVSKSVVLGNGQDAEDLRVYLNAYTPDGTSIHVYGKFLNSDDYEAMSDKNWTPLEEINPTTYVSSTTDKNDIIEKEFRIPFFHNDGTTLSGYITGETSNNIVATTTDLSGNVTANSSIVRVYQEASPNTFYTSLVRAANSTTITLADAATASFNSTALKIELVSTKNKHSAFINPQNSNIVRYYTKDLSQKDTYKKFAIKIVLLSEETFKAPLVRDVRAIAVSA